MKDLSRSRSYYDEFSSGYERHRHQGYHQFIDDLEVSLAQEHCQGRVLEAGCGTGLILRRLAVGAKEAIGLDLSAGMLAWARARGLRVLQGSVDAVPFPDGYFDAVVSFKVLAHVPTIAETVAELVRVTRPGGYLVLEFYNRYSLRHLIKVLKQPTRIGRSYTDEDVFTRYDSLADVRSYLPANARLRRVHGVRVLTPSSHFHDLPVVKAVLNTGERFAASAPLLRHLGGFLVVVLQRTDDRGGD